MGMGGAIGDSVHERFERIVVQITLPVGEVCCLDLAKAKRDIHIVDERREENLTGRAFIGFIGDEPRGHRITRPDYDNGAR